MSVIRCWFQRRPLLPNGRLFRWRASMLVQHLRIIQFIQKRHTLGGCSQRKGFTSILQIACKPLLIIKKPLSCGAYILLLAVYFVRHSQFFAALSATRSQYATTISRLHTLSETMLVVSFSVVGLECSFHFCILFRYYSVFRTAKVTINFLKTKQSVQIFQKYFHIHLIFKPIH